MEKFDQLKALYIEKGVREDNFEFALDCVREGIAREHILETLTADYRGMNIFDATEMLEDMFSKNGGEFKKENRNGYWRGALFLLMGLPLCYYILYVLYYGGVIYYPLGVFLGAGVFTLAGIVLIAKAIAGKYRDTDDPENRNAWHN